LPRFVYFSAGLVATAAFVDPASFFFVFVPLELVAQAWVASSAGLFVLLFYLVFDPLFVILALS